MIFSQKTHAFIRYYTPLYVSAYPAYGQKLYRNQNIGEGFRTFVYTPDVTGKGDALTKASTAHRTDVGLLAIVHSSNVEEEISFL